MASLQNAPTLFSSAAKVILWVLRRVISWLAPETQLLSQPSCSFNRASLGKENPLWGNHCPGDFSYQSRNVPTVFSKRLVSFLLPLHLNTSIFPILTTRRPKNVFTCRCCRQISIWWMLMHGYWGEVKSKQPDSQSNHQGPKTQSLESLPETSGYQCWKPCDPFLLSL